HRIRGHTGYKVVAIDARPESPPDRQPHQAALVLEAVKVWPGKGGVRREVPLKKILPHLGTQTIKRWDIGIITDNKSGECCRRRSGKSPNCYIQIIPFIGFNPRSPDAENMMAKEAPVK